VAKATTTSKTNGVELDESNSSTTTKSADPWDLMMQNAEEVASTFRKRPQVKVSSPWREGFGRPLSQRSREIYEHITANKTRLKQK
jgi:dsDNA-binding SOS-regulon protein